MSNPTTTRPGHSPGPWRREVRESPIQPTDKTLPRRMYWKILGADGDSVATGAYTLREHADCDAALIAAAPALLEACRRALISLEDYNDGDSGDQWSASQHPTIKILEAAIAKATGS